MKYNAIFEIKYRKTLHYGTACAMLFVYRQKGVPSMAKVSVLMPHPELKALAVSLIAQYPRISPLSVEFVQTEQIRDRAVALEEAGCDLIVARGLQARIARESVRIPIVEMRASTQELASQVLEMKHALQNAGKPPRIGLIGSFNMFHSTERFNEILGVALNVYTAVNIGEYPFLVDRAFGDGCAGVIGGEQVGIRARELGMVCRFLSMGEESIREAFEAASMLSYSIDLDKRANAEMNAMLDNASTGIFQVNAEGIIQRANRPCFALLDRSDIIGQPAAAVFPGIPKEDYRAALQGGSEIDAAVMTVNQATVLMNMTPVIYENRVEGAICTFHESGHISEMDHRLRQEAARKGWTANCRFADFPTGSERFRHTLVQARRLSRTPACVLLEGESGTGRGMLAQCIHNESADRDRAFVEVDCAGWHPDDLDGLLFGGFSSRAEAHSLAEQAAEGTLYLKHIEALSPELQYKVYLLTRGSYLRNRRVEMEGMRVRVIASTDVDLRAMVGEGRFRRDLYYALAAGKLMIPPFRERREDMPYWLDRALDDVQKQYRRYITLAREAREWLERQAWPGNLHQMSGLCRRLVLLSEKRTVTLDMARKQLDMMDAAADSTETKAVCRAPEAIALMACLQENLGDRQKAARALGISTTTLWRRMKRLGIRRDLTWEDESV